MLGGVESKLNSELYITLIDLTWKTRVKRCIGIIRMKRLIVFEYCYKRDEVHAYVT